LRQSLCLPFLDKACQDSFEQVVFVAKGGVEATSILGSMLCMRLPGNA